jgi:lysyl-tRNA synthetase class 2
MQPFWHPDQYLRRRPHLADRATILKAWREWFVGQGFLEVDTPVMQVSPGCEVHMRGFSTMLHNANPAQRCSLWLQTSPEFAMKKILVAGEPKIFQFAHSFRNGERTERHHPEFTMLEWYRLHDGYETLQADCAALLRQAALAVGRNVATWQGMSCDLTAELEILPVEDAFQRYCGFSILGTAEDSANPDASLPLLLKQAKKTGIHLAPDDRWEDIFFRFVLEFIEPKLGAGRPTVLTDYPVSMAALARAKPSDPRVAERFELYACGLELANGYGELTDPVIQRQRFEADMALKERLYGERFPIDPDFLAALEFGLPSCAGIALGFDRMVMLASGASRIEDVLWLPLATVE